MARTMNGCAEKHAEKKLGRVECRYEYNEKSARYDRKQVVLDAKDKPRLNPLHATPAARGMGVVKPGEE